MLVENVLDMNPIEDMRAPDIVTARAPNLCIRNPDTEPETLNYFNINKLVIHIRISNSHLYFFKSEVLVLSQCFGSCI